MNYRRARVPASYLFTVALRDRRSWLLREHVEGLQEAFRAVRRQSPFRIDWVGPDHLHSFWTFPEGEEDVSGRWRAIKGRVTR